MRVEASFKYKFHIHNEASIQYKYLFTYKDSDAEDEMVVSPRYHYIAFRMEIPGFCIDALPFYIQTISPTTVSCYS